MKGRVEKVYRFELDYTDMLYLQLVLDLYEEDSDGGNSELHDLIDALLNEKLI